MKKVFALIVLVIIVFSVCGQNAQVKWGAPFKAKTLRYNFRVVSSDARGLTIITPTPSMFAVNGVSVIKYDANLTFSSVKNIPLADGEKKLDYEFIVRMKGHTLVFSSYTDLKNSSKVLYYNDFDINTLTLSPRAVKVIEMPVVTKPLPQTGSYSYTLSPDSAKLALIYNPPAGKDKQQKFACVVLDETLKIISNRTDVFPFKDRNFNLESSAVSQQGVVFLNGTLTTGPANFFKKEPNYEYVVLMMTPDDAPFKNIPVKLDDYFVTTMQIGCDYNGDLFAAGFYSETSSYTLKGSVSVKIDGQTGEVLNSYHKEFPMEVITAGLTEKQAERVESKSQKGKNIELPSFEFREFVLRPDNGLYLVAEQSYSVTTTTTNGNGQTTSHTTYYSKNIIVVGLNESGECDLTQVVLKNQSASTPEILSYVMVSKGADLYFMFTDNALNNAPHPPTTQRAVFTKAGITTIACLNSKGEIIRKPLYKFEKWPFIVIRSLSESLPNGDVLLVGRKGKSAAMGLVTIPD